MPRETIHRSGRYDLEWTLIKAKINLSDLASSNRIFNFEVISVATYEVFTSFRDINRAGSDEFLVTLLFWFTNGDFGLERIFP